MGAKEITRRAFHQSPTWVTPLLLAASVGLAAAQVGAQDKLPPPSPEQLQKAEQLIRDLFKAEFAKAQLPSGKLALAQKLLQQAKETTGDPAGRFVLLREARDLAADAGAVGVVLEAIDQIAKHHAIRVLEMKADSLARAGKVAQPVASTKTQAQAALAVLSEAVAADDFDAATRMAPAILAAARTVSDGEQFKRTKARLKEVEDTQAAFDATRALRERLKQAPDDGKANLAVGKYLCFWKGAWEQGLPLLAKGDDLTLRALAIKELTQPKQFSQQLELGDAWWSLGEKEESVARTNVWARAAQWYDEAAPAATGLAKTRALQRLAVVGKLLGTNTEAGASQPAPAKEASVATLLKKKLHGKASIHPKTGEWVIRYDFKDKNQLNDFELNGAKPTLTGGILSLQGGERIDHVVKFQTLTITGQMNASQWVDRVQVLTSQDWLVNTHGFIYRGKGCEVKPYLNVREFGAFEFTITPNRVALKNGRGGQCGHAVENAVAGRVGFAGGQQGNRFAQIVLTGLPDPAWAKEFLGE